MPALHIDIETYSEADLRKVGAYRYAADPSFEILLVAWSFADDQHVCLEETIHSGEISHELRKHLLDPEVTVHAHNAAFERTCFRALGIDVPLERWRCTMVKAAYCGLPLSLKMLSEVLELRGEGKMAEGRKLIRYFCQPCKPTKANEKRTRNWPEHAPEQWAAFGQYCQNDVHAEKAVARKLSMYDLPAIELQMYQLDQRINDRGVKVDTELARQANRIDEQADEIVSSELIALTGLENPNSPAQLKEWLSQAMKKPINSLAKAKIPQLIEDAPTEAVREVLQLRQRSSKTSTKKYDAMLATAGPDERARGLFQFYGANRTGRWAGRLIQLQNLPRNELTDLADARTLALNGEYAPMRTLYGNVADTLSQLIRTAFIAPEGKLLAVADFSAIEARVIAWLAREGWRMEVFRTHGKIYEASAAMMFGVPLESIDKGSPLRQKGKIAELALGYGGSVGAMKTMGAEAMGLSEQEMRQVVEAWRAKNTKIVSLWYTIEGLAKQAVRSGKDQQTADGRVGMSYDKQNLILTLPSGRELFYRHPGFGVNRFGSESLTYYNLDQATRKWDVTETYGGKLVENIIQAIARDVLRDAMLALDKRGFEIVMHVHDEAVCEVPVGFAEQQLKEMCAVMSEDTPWAPGLPNKAEGYLTPFYKKD